MGNSVLCFPFSVLSSITGTRHADSHFNANQVQDHDPKPAPHQSSVPDPNLGLPDQDPLARGTDPDLDSDTELSIMKQK